jgi:ABC-type transport system substrate-binding protein
MKRFDRRALFATGAAAALLAATGTSVNATPRTGGRLRLAVPRDGAMMEQVARGALYDTLTEIGPDGLLRGELAQSWTSSDDARIWHFELRDDVEFHDGTGFASADAAASILASPQADALGIRAVQAEGAQTLRLELAAGNPGLPYAMADSSLIIAPRGEVDLPLAQACGTGCYRVERAEPGRHFRASRIEGHYKAGSAGWADQVEIIVIPDAAVRAQALREGYVDVAALPEPKGLRQRGEFIYHPSAQDMALATHSGVGLPKVIGTRAPLDDGRIAERWWRL